MSGWDIVRYAIFSLAVVILPIQLWSASGCAAEAAAKSEELEVTPSLVREIQFMLLRLGMEPGPIDGVIGPQTTRAWHKFQQDTGLQPVDLVNGSKIPATVLTRLRSEASRGISSIICGQWRGQLGGTDGALRGGRAASGHGVTVAGDSGLAPAGRN